MDTDASEVRRARIGWRCRRGMRELDLLLARFLEAGLGSMSEADLGRLEGLLAEPDQDILAWLTGAAAPPDADTGRIVGIIRNTIGTDLIDDD